MIQADSALQMPVLSGTTDAAASATDGFSLWEMTLNGGWLMIPLALLSLVAI
jgi:hypothetical protein